MGDLHLVGVREPIVCCAPASSRSSAPDPSRPARPVQRDGLTLEDAKRLEGTELRITSTPDILAITILIDGVQHTHAGPEEFDDHGRTVILRGAAFALRATFGRKCVGVRTD